jgi:uncharacterized protein (TIGR03435 family)
MARMSRRLALAGLLGLTVSRLPLLIAMALLSHAALGVAQSVATPPAFEVVSIKPRTGEPAPRRSSSPDRFIDPDTTLRDLIEYAYELAPMQLLGGPDWMATRRFAVEATAAGTPTRVEMRLLVRTLLAGRFNLKAHADTREMAVYLLERVRADGPLGPALRPTPSRECAEAVARLEPGGAPDAPPPCGVLGASPDRVTARGVTLGQFARNIRDLGGMTGVDRIVLDKTTLTGAYDIDELRYRPVETSRLTGGDDNPGFFDALREQLGLKLTPARAPVDVLVIDSATQPAPD